MTNAVSNPTVSAVIGASVGGVVGFLSGLGSGLAGQSQTATRHPSRRGAGDPVRAEPNIPKLKGATAPGLLSTRTCDDLMVPLFTDLPDDIAQKVSMAYAMLHVTVRATQC